MRAVAEKRLTRKNYVHWGVVAVVLSVGLFSGMYDARPVEASDVLPDCKKFEIKELDSSVLVKGVGPFRFATGPEFTKAAESWDLVVYGIVGRYAGLCTRFTAGLATKTEYETGLKEIDQYYREAKELETKLSATLQRSRDGIHVTDARLEQAITDLAARVRQARGHERMSSPGRPVPPKKPRTILGTPGREEEPAELLR